MSVKNVVSQIILSNYQASKLLQHIKLKIK